MAEEAGLPIIDAHHHYWDLSLGAHPWLCKDPMIPFRYGDYSAIRRDFMPVHYDAGIGHHNVVATVTMEGEWDEADPVGETRWLATVIAEQGRPAAHVARAILHRDDAEEVLAGHAAFAFVRGIRHKPAAAARPDLIVHGTPGSMSDPAWRRGYAILTTHGLHFELQAPWWHVDELLDLVGAHPETPVVINHAFMPADRSPEGLAAWSAVLKRAATIPNAALKISGIGIRDRPWQLSDQRQVIETCLDAFGTDRCLFASNFPVDSLCGSFETIYDGFKAAIAGLPQMDQVKLLNDNAKRFYRISH